MVGIKSAVALLLTIVIMHGAFQNLARAQTPAANPPPANPAKMNSEFDDPDLKELEREKQKALEQVNTLNQLNPLNTGGVPLAGGATGEAGKIDTSKLPPQLKWVVPLLQNDQIQKRSRAFVAVAQDAAFQKNADLIMKNPNLNWMFGGYVIVFVMYLIVKSRVLAASDRFLVRLMLRLALVPVLFGGLFLVAYGVLGQPIVEVMTIMAKGLLRI